MGLKWCFWLIFSLFTVGYAEVQGQNIGGLYFDALSSNNMDRIEIELEKLKAAKSTPFVRACQGALLMKLANFQKGAPAKIQHFKKGRELLENEINQFPQVVEFRFLRLTVQENAPSLLKYQDQIKEDVQIILEGFHGLDKTFQKAVSSYARQSKHLSEEKLSEGDKVLKK
ncbi:hypothetical protein [Dyadobacter tibetensis]|uniref:hypothetical protein n=1 Tax=Dyadobacter tibetensis TaxID=1211851 RepID=UPI00047051FB|nr:hypothetical protein [Dyadobacter tibetensis]